MDHPGTNSTDEANYYYMLRIDNPPARSWQTRRIQLIVALACFIVFAAILAVVLKYGPHQHGS